jgi:uncharacterized protein (DUF58 family)
VNPTTEEKPADNSSDTGAAREEREAFIRRLKRIDILSGGKSRGLLAGCHRSFFRGRGIECIDVREYLPGDEIRAIDWNVTARQNQLFVREFSEDREQTYYITLDLSGSGEFGSDMSIRDRGREIAASLLLAAARNNDRTGLLLFTDRVERYVPAQKGRSHFLRLINLLITSRPRSRGTDLVPPIRYLAGSLKRQASVIIISDFNATGFGESLRLLRKRHDVTAIRLNDPRESNLPDVGLIMLEDPESGEQILADTSDPEFRSRYRDAVTKDYEDLRRLFGHCGVSEVPLLTTEAYETALNRYFQRNRIRGHRAGIL